MVTPTCRSGPIPPRPSGRNRDRLMRPMTTKTRRRLAALIVVLIAAVLAAVRADRLLLGRIHGGDAVFEVKPYLQLGDAPSADRDGHERLTLLWQTTDAEAAWSVE